MSMTPIDDILAELTPEHRAAIQRRYEELRATIEPKPSGDVPLPEPSGETYPFYGLNQLVDYGDAREAAGRAAGGVAGLEFTMNEATRLLAFFGGNDARVTVELHPDRVDNDRMHFAGLYAYATEYPEEGAEYLGPVEVQDSAAAPAGQRPPAEGVGTVSRTAQEIVQQTEELAALFMLEVYSREAVGGDHVFREATDPRGKHCWQLACRAQEMLTATDPENAVTEIDDEPAAAPQQTTTQGEAVADALHWLRSALDCFPWSPDQRVAAEAAYISANKATGGSDHG